MARTYPEKKEAAMSHISHHAAAGENPASRKPPVEETPGRKIVKGLFCAGVALSAALFSGPVWSDDVFIGPSNGNIKIDKKLRATYWLVDMKPMKRWSAGIRSPLNLARR